MGRGGAGIETKDLSITLKAAAEAVQQVEATPAAKQPEVAALISTVGELTGALAEADERAKRLERELTEPRTAQIGLVRCGNANAVGELLREQTFVGEGLGCYYNSDVRSDAVEWSAEQREDYWTQIDWIERDDDPWNDYDMVVSSSHGYSFSFEGLTVEACWYWDGDGVLTFRVWEGERLLRSLQNTDCKKTYRWNDEDAPGKEQRPIVSI